MGKRYYVYILTNSRNTVLYTGVTGDLVRRMEEHRNKAVSGFTARYSLQKLVYFEVLESAYRAIQREKRIKGGSRGKKIRLVESWNPEWRDLAGSL